MTGPDLRYDVDGLRSCASGHDDAAGRAEALAAGLAGIVVLAREIGGTPAVAGFAAAAQRARDAQAGGARAEARRRADLAARARDTADLGERLDADTAAIAGGGAPGPNRPGNGADVPHRPGPPG